MPVRQRRRTARPNRPGPCGGRHESLANLDLARKVGDVLAATNHAPFRHQPLSGIGWGKETRGELGGRAPLLDLERRHKRTAQGGIEQNHVNPTVGRTTLVEMIFGQGELQPRSTRCPKGALHAKFSHVADRFGRGRKRHSPITPTTLTRMRLSRCPSNSA